MEMIEKSLTHFSFPLGSHQCLLDIETTGLNKTHHAIICIGVTYSNAQGLLFYKQWFSHTLDEEKQLLMSFLAWINSYSSIYTYNGNSFDIPFIVSRLQLYGLAGDFLQKHGFIDLQKKLRKLASKRSALEALLGYKREITLSGKELVKLYTLYLTTQLPQYKALILVHNEEELKSLWVLYEAYHILYHIPEFPYHLRAREDNTLEITLTSPSPFMSSLNITLNDMSINWQKGETSFSILFVVSALTLRKYLSPAKDYYFIPSQNQLMHRSVAVFLPKDLKQKVSKSDCYVTKTSYFIRVYSLSQLNLPIWYNEDKETFIEYLEGEKELSSVLFRQVFYALTH